MKGVGDTAILIDGRDRGYVQMQEHSLPLGHWNTSTPAWAHSNSLLEAQWMENCLVRICCREKEDRLVRAPHGIHRTFKNNTQGQPLVILYEMVISEKSCELQEHKWRQELCDDCEDMRVHQWNPGRIFKYGVWRDEEHRKCQLHSSVLRENFYNNNNQQSQTPPQ